MAVLSGSNLTKPVGLTQGIVAKKVIEIDGVVIILSMLDDTGNIFFLIECIRFHFQMILLDEKKALFRSSTANTANSLIAFVK